MIINVIPSFSIFEGVYWSSAVSVTLLCLLFKAAASLEEIFFELPVSVPYRTEIVSFSVGAFVSAAGGVVPAAVLSGFV